jgi:HAD superfamily phosphatase (TIGR01668 family)
MSWRLLELLSPKLFAPSLGEVDLNALAERGVDSIILDLDNTILPWRDYEIPPESADWVRRALERGMSLCIASNTRNPRRLRAVAQKLGISCFDRIAKPRRRGLRAAMETMCSVPSRTAIIGDQIFTDILGGNRLGLLTVLVRPMHRREFVGTKVSRLFEKLVLTWLSKRGMSGTKAARQASERQD